MQLADAASVDAVVVGDDQGTAAAIGGDWGLLLAALGSVFLLALQL